MKTNLFRHMNLLLVATLLVAALGIASPAHASNFANGGEPETLIFTMPPDPDTDTTPTFTFDESGGRGAATFMCRMDGGTYASCVSPFTSPSLADGAHIFEVYAISQEGVPDSTPASYSWLLDATAPVLNLPADMFVPATNPAGEAVNFTVTATDTVDPDPIVVCTPPSGSTFPLGETTVNCTATDDIGHVTSGSFNITVGGNGPYTLRVRSNGTNDGMVRESTETSGIGGYSNAVNHLIAIGDDSLKRQYVGILDFDTSNLPDNAFIASAKLQVKVMVISNGVYAKLGNLIADITNPNFGTLPSLQNADFQNPALANAGAFSKTTKINQWITLQVSDSSLFAVNLLGRTQFRVRFTLDDSNDLFKHQIGFLGGDYKVVTDRPLLVVTYYVP